MHRFARKGWSILGPLVLGTLVGCSSDAESSNIGSGGSGGAGDQTTATGATSGSTGSGSSSSTSGGQGGGGQSSGGQGGAQGMGGAGQGGAGGGSAAVCNVQRIDLLLALDNSRSMADKQELLQVAVPDLVRGLVNPPCVDPSGAPAPSQPASPQDACPAGAKRAFTPQTDIHIGVISSSLGSHGADTCQALDNTSCANGATNTSNDDHGHLLTRTDPCGTSTVPTYQSKGFLAWDPAQKQSPPGESSLDGGLLPALKDMIVGAGQIGCGYESQLESVYRFLVDPAPYDHIEVQSGKATPVGTDLTLLAQRDAFLRPDSLLTVITLSDENDCSIKEYGQYYLVAQARVGASNFRMPRARQECANNPDDPCCKSCGQAPGNCPTDASCQGPNGGVATLSAEEDPLNLRCFEQKKRFGIDFLYPTDRYTLAFTSKTVADLQGNLVPNPIFAGNRDPSLVVFAGVVGVPWQDVARDPQDASKGVLSPAELAKADANGVTRWDVILGDPASYVPPKDPLMVESVTPRAGTNPITGDAIAPAGSPAGTNPINGHEYTTTDDLQYACIFPLPPGAERDCSNPSPGGCDCAAVPNDNPLCAMNASGQPTLQVRAKAYPGRRQLQVIKGLGEQGLVSSACPAQTNDATQPTYGYRPAMSALIAWLVRHGC